MAGSSLAAFFRPRSVALVGASARQGNLFAKPLHHLLGHGFAGDVYPVNPKHREIAGLRTFPDIASIGAPVDLALLLVPAPAVVEQLRELGRLGTRAAVVFASGFAEADETGRALQRELVAEAGRVGMRLVGPNCQGVIDVPARLAATFTAAVDVPLPPASGIAYVGQSGAVGGTVFDLAREAGTGLTAWVSTGNEADVDSLEAAQFLLERDDVRTLLLYLESSPDPQRYAELGRTAVVTGKHVVCLRTGRTAAGQRAVASHTGSIVAPDLPFRLLSEREGIVVVDDVDTLVRVAHELNTRGTRTGARVAAVSTSGGAASLAADVLTEDGWELPTLSQRTQQRLAELVPAFAAVANPVDVTAQLFSRAGRRFPEACTVVLDDDAVDALVVLVTMATGAFGRELAEDVVATWSASDKPVYFVWMAGGALTREGRDVLARAGMPVYASVSELARTLRHLRHREPPVDVAVREPQLGATLCAPPGPCILTEWEGGALLDAAGVPHPSGVLVTAPGHALEAAVGVPGPYACKLQSPHLVHKSESGAVRLGVALDELEAVVADLLRLAASSGLRPDEVQGVLVQPMAPPGLELLVSVLGSELGFPPVATVGFGGVTAEVDPDAVSFLLPASSTQILARLRCLRRAPLLFGHRGSEPLDVDAVVAVVQRLGAAAVALGPRLRELEINPLVVQPRGGGAVALDFLARFAGPREEGQ